MTKLEEIGLVLHKLIADRTRYIGSMGITRAVVEAMREPGRTAIEAGNTVSEDAGSIWEPSNGVSFDGPSCGLEVWQAMIDAILNEKP